MPHRRPAIEVWASMRTLYEGAQATPELLAAISGLRTETVAFRVGKEGWQAASRNPRRARVQRMIDEATERIAAFPQTDGENARAVQELIRTEMLRVALMDKLAAAADSADARKEAAKAETENVAEILERLNGRIVELARDYARQLVPGDAE